MKTYGLIGKNLSHSYSPGYFRKKFQMLGIDAQYLLFDLQQISGFHNLLEQQPGILGLNVTIPYKKEIIPYLDALDEVASQVTSVNTICFRKKGGKVLLKGYNTDVPGFESTLLQFLGSKKGVRALVLGTGGSSAAVTYVLRKLSISYISVSRQPENDKVIDYGQLDENILKENKLIINTTPLGMFPEVSGMPPIPYQFISAGHFLYDLVYNPSETEFLKRGKAQGAKAINGLNMLIRQAEESWKLWISA